MQKDKVCKVAYITPQGVPEKTGRNRTDHEIKAVEAMEMFLKQKNSIIPLQQEVFSLV